MTLAKTQLCKDIVEDLASVLKGSFKNPNPDKKNLFVPI
jgi:hypothetical protein